MWSEADSGKFIDYGRYFVPERAGQIETICGVIPASEAPFTIWELGCGEGLLAEALLTRFPTATVVGWDRSAAMLASAQERNARFGDRFRPASFSLAETDWRYANSQLRAVVSSLVIHHLDDRGKAELYEDMAALLEPGGVLVIADVIQPASAAARELAAHSWDELVREQALLLDGDTAAYEFFVADKWNIYRFPDPMDTPSTLYDNLTYLRSAGLRGVDVYWMMAGHAIFGGQK